MRMLNRFMRRFALFVINHFLSGTHFFGAKRALLRIAGIEIGDTSKVVGPLHLGGVASLKLGDYVWLGRNASIDGNGTVEIGDWVDVGPCVSFGTGGHEIGPHEHRAGEGVIAHISVGSGTWIGQNVVVVNNSSIGGGVLSRQGLSLLGIRPMTFLWPDFLQK